MISAVNLNATNLFTYCGNNPVSNADNDGAFWDTVFDVVSLAFSVVDVISNPSDVGAWIGLAGDIIDLIPFVSGVGEAARAVNVADDILDAADDIHDAAKIADRVDDAGDALTTVGKIDNIDITVDCCFVAGTVILTENGKVPIEEIQVGDYVWAWDEESGNVALKRVEDTFIRESSELVHIYVNGEEIIATPEHPFYTPVYGWTSAAHLRAGDILVLVNGEYVVVEKVQHELLESPVKVYNFQVEDYHTYYVGVGVLVHNDCYNAPKGGGGISDTVNVNGTDVTFGHGGRHLEGTGINVADVNHAIAQDVVSRGLPMANNVSYYDMEYAGRIIHYSAKRITETLINVGTYYVK